VTWNIIKSGVADARQIERGIEMLFAERTFPLDIIVRTPEQVEAALAAGNSFVRREVLARGRVIYEKSAG